MTLYKWSKTAATNSSADSTINWAEGQSPSSVNDSARAEMAAVAKYRDDQSGSIVTAGSSTAYTATTNQVFDSLANMNGHCLRLRMDETSGTAPTLNVDGLGAKAIVLVPGSAIASGTLKVNAVYDFVYDNANSCWILVGGNPGEFPSTTIMLFRQTAAPTGWTKDTTNFNNHAIRVTTGTVSNGGSTGFTSVFAARTIAHANLPAATLTTTITDPGHSHTYDEPLNATLVRNDANNISVWQGVVTGGQATSTDTTGITASTALGGSGTAMDFAVQYVDSIFAIKD